MFRCYYRFMTEMLKMAGEMRECYNKMKSIYSDIDCQFKM